MRGYECELFQVFIRTEQFGLLVLSNSDFILKLIVKSFELGSGVVKNSGQVSEFVFAVNLNSVIEVAVSDYFRPLGQAMNRLNYGPIIMYRPIVIITSIKAEKIAFT